ncbi:hypothetical protein JEZ13_01185 [bacterium]|nr:hypothetical protein [bacterium]
MIKLKRWDDSGFTIIELILSSLIVLIAIVGLFVGVQFTEKQVFKNQRIRKAVLLSSGILEYQNFVQQKYSTFQYNGDDVPFYKSGRDFYKLDNGRNLKIYFDTSIPNPVEYNFNTETYRRTRITVQASWNEPSKNNERQIVKMVEDYYASQQ